MESARHRWLKRVAARWLVESDWVALAQEVTLPGGRMRADVAGWTDRLHGRGGPANGARTVLIECKAHRSDFLRDALDVGDLLERRASLHEAVCRTGVNVRRLLSGPSGPDVGQDEDLFAGIDTTCDTDRAWHLRHLRLSLMAVNRRLHAPAKFARLAWWRAADELWVASPVGLLRRRDLPTGWGLLEVYRQGRVQRRVDAPEHVASAAWRARLLRNIAVASTRAFHANWEPHPVA